MNADVKLSTRLRHGRDGIVLGAWGCGAFGNEPAEIAPLFRRALSENFRGAYRHVVFAIVDWSPERCFIGPFEAEVLAVTGLTLVVAQPAASA